MTIRFLANHNLEHFLDLLRQSGQLHGPVRGDDGVVRFARLAPGMYPDLPAVRTLLPVKKYLLPPQETILNYTAEFGYQLPEEKPPPIVLLGLHPCDLAGISYLDRLFLGDEPDPLYAARRSALILIGVSCTPDEFCSCSRCPCPLPAQADLFLQAVDDGFAVTGGSPQGARLLEDAGCILDKRDLAVQDDTRCFFGHRAEGKYFPAMDARLPEWREFADGCLGCGACSLCCPTCACFDVREYGGLDGTSALRVRQWDNCLFEGHGQVAGGMNFRRSREERFRYRFLHKYHGFGSLHGVPACVGCGRCRVACPSGIDLRPLAERFKGDAP